MQANYLSQYIFWFILKVSSLVFFYDNDIFFYGSVAILCASYFWCIFKKFILNDSYFFFVLGILLFFNLHFSWFFSGLLLLSLLTLNSLTAAYLSSFVLTLLGPFLFEVPYTFLNSHLILITLFILKNNVNISHMFTEKKDSLYILFRNRNTSLS